MTTHERELTGPVELCPDGHTLATEATGWSRTPLHTASLRGRWGRTKRWDYWAVLAGDLALSVTYADVDYLGIASVWWCDLATGREGGREVDRPGARGVQLPDRPGSQPLRFRSGALSLDIVDDASGTEVRATWTEKDGSPASLDVHVDLPVGHESVNVVIPWSATRFQYTSKHQARPATGTLTVGGAEREIGPDAWGVLDVGRGRWPYRTRWNWAGGAGRSTAGATVGLQFGGKWTEGTGATENGVIVDGRVSKIGAELEWAYRWSQPLEPWRVRHRDGSIDLQLVPAHDRHAKVQAVVLATEVHQVFGRWTGHVTEDDGTVHHLDAIQGFAEEARSRW